MNLRRANRAVHRDLGYFFFGMCIIYGISGIALNHRHEWNSNFIIEQETFTAAEADESLTGRAMVMEVLKQAGDGFEYKTHLESGSHIRIFVEGGTINYNRETGAGHVERIRKRPVFNEMNFLHYNTPRKLWTWFSDLYALGLVILAVSGLFVLKGKNGFSRRGVYFVATGILIPLLLLYLYLSH